VTAGKNSLLFSVGSLAAAALLLESTLTRLLAVAQFYHFAFLVVSLALLGFGASGTLLSLIPGLRAVPIERLLAWSGIGFAASVAVAYAAVNWLPFDSYSIAWEQRQLLYFILYYLALTLPFLCGGIGIGAALAASAGRSHQVYAANLLGSAAGVLLAPAALWLAGVPGAVLASAAVGLLATLPGMRLRVTGGRAFPAWARLTAWLALMASLAGIIALAALNLGGRGPLGMTISPYKGLASAWRYPGSTTVYGRWNAISRVDVVANAGTRLLPGLSYVYTGLPPPQDGLSVDADAVQPITLVAPQSFDAAPFMPEAVAFELRPGAETVVLEPGGGLGVLQALAGSAARVTAVLGNPLVRQAVARAAASVPPSSPGEDIYAESRVDAVLEPGRAHLLRDHSAYDIVFLPLTDAYHPVASGAYSLAESYTLTVEAFEEMLARLAPDGILVATRWLQTPPSEDLRLIATLVEALGRRGGPPPAQALVAYRGIQTLTVLVQPRGWSAEELATVRRFAESRKYDLVWAPDIRPDEVNRFNRMPAAEHFEATAGLLSTADRRDFYARYPFDVVPATDDRPFFFHFFRWGQTPQVLATLGRTWQPFGGSGYLVLFALLALVLLLSAALILLPLAVGFSRMASAAGAGGSPTAAGSPRLRLRVLGYFGLLGIAFLFVEIPLIQRWILLFGHPIYAFTAVVLTLLLFSSLGSVLSRSPWLPRRAVIGVLALLVLLTAVLGPYLVQTTLPWPPFLRVLAAVVSLAPLAVLMGFPFPLGLAWLEDEAPQWVPWAWAVNGCASVVASVLAAILALSYGFTAVLLSGAGAYAVAWLVFRATPSPSVTRTR
jgi:hypothetical protein